MALEEAVQQEITQLIGESDVVLFMKGNRQAPQCGFSATVVGILDSMLPDYHTVDVLAAPHIRDGIKAFSSWPTVPQLYVKGEFIGGCDIIQEMFGSGEIYEALGVEPVEVIQPKIEISAAAAEALQQAVTQNGGAGRELHLSVDATFQSNLSIAPRTGSNLPKVREISVSMNQTGLAPVLKHMEEALAPSQIYSLLIALIFVIFLLILLQRSVIGGIISVVPISMTILLNFAVMGYIGIGLDSFTSMIASIAIGLGIDYAVHFNSRFRRELSELKDELKALKKTLGTTGVAIIINALTVGLGFLVLLLAGGQHIRRFGGLTALTLFSSALFTLTVLPTLILVFKPAYLRKEVKL